MVSGPQAHRPQPGHAQQPIQTAQLPSWLHGFVSANRIAREAQRGNTATIGSLLRGLSSTDPSVRLSSSRSLATASNFGNCDVLNALLNIQGDAAHGIGVEDPDATVRASSVEVVGELASGNADFQICQKLLKTLRDDDWAVRRATTVALSKVAKVDDNVVLEYLLSMMREEAWWAKAVASETIRHIASRGNVRAVEHLLRILCDEDWAVRKSSCLALGKVARFGDITVVEALLALLEDGDWRVRKAAIEAIGDLADPGCDVAIRGLISRLEDKHVGERKSLDTPSLEDGDVKSTAVKSLLRVARPGDQTVIDALRHLCFRDPSSQQMVQDAIIGLSVAS